MASKSHKAKNTVRTYEWNVFGTGKFGKIGHFVGKVAACTKAEAEELAKQLEPSSTVEINWLATMPYAYARAS